jgi:hypothetical protein
MRIIAFVISLFIASLGAVGAVSPMRFLSIIRKFESPGGISAATVLRMVLGTSLYFSAVASRITKLLRYIGMFTFISGLLTPVVGLKRFSRLLAWWSARGSTFMRVWAVSALAIGLLLAWAVSPWIRREIREELKAP